MVLQNPKENIQERFSNDYYLDSWKLSVNERRTFRKEMKKTEERVVYWSIKDMIVLKNATKTWKPLKTMEWTIEKNKN